MQICISSFFEYQLNESLQSANSVGLQTQYIFNDAVYIHFSGVYIGCLRAFICFLLYFR